MAVLKRKLAASSIPEVIVASVVLMIAFMVTMETLTRLVTRREDSVFCLTVEMELRRCYRQFADDPCEFVREYDWGEIRGEVAAYRGELVMVTLKAVVRSGSSKIEYKYLMKDEKKVFTRLYTD